MRDVCARLDEQLVEQRISGEARTAKKRGWIIQNIMKPFMLPGTMSVPKPSDGQIEALAVM